MDRPGHTNSQRIGKTTPTEKLSRHRRTSTAESNSSASSHRQQATQVDLSSFEHVSFDAHQVPDPATTQSVMWDVPFAGFEMVTQPPLGGGDLSWSDLFAGRQCLGPNQSTLGTDHPITSGEDDTQLTQWYCDDFLLGTSSDTDAAGTRDLLYKDVSPDTVPMSPPQLGRWLSATLESSSEEVAFNHFSMHSHGKTNGETVTDHRTRSLLLLKDASELLKSQNKSDGQKWMEQHQSLSVLSLQEVTLASYLMHIVADVMIGSQKTETHLQAAFSLMVELDYVDRLPQGFYSRFLVQRFAMIDVVLSFLRRRRPLAPQNFTLYQPIEGADKQEPCFRELTGCQQPVLSFLARISLLAGDNTFKDPAHFAEAYQLETEMRSWATSRYPGPGLKYASGSINILDATQDGADVENFHKELDTLSECFYWVAHLLLARRVFLDPTTSPRVQLYRRHLFSLMDRLPAGCGPDSSLPFPFYMAAREAISNQDKDWVRKKHADMFSIYPDQSRELMMRLTEEIWRKNDCIAAAVIQDPLSDLSWVDDDVYIGILDSQASHFLF
ncbi:fungal-specific transcription factor domain-containing protein [Fusarium acuminatum]|uniref:Fungal-specific transcription factor domain-containing protein n=1 Tax=Fusarium acuminatum TaxID=5515 RepID=A0ABZ2XB82_9HYPO